MIRRNKIEMTNIIKADLERIVNNMNIYYGFNILKQTRKREYIDARRIFVRLVYHKYNMGTLSEDSKKVKGITLEGLGVFMGLAHSSILHTAKTFYVIEDDVEQYHTYTMFIPMLYADNGAIIEGIKEDRKAILKQLAEVDAKLELYSNPSQI